MKKHNLLKTLGIFFLILVALTWIIPAGTYSGSEFTKGTTTPIGLFDLFRLPLITIGTFIQYGLVFLAIGGLYGVLNKAGVLVPFVDKVVKKWKGKECRFLTIVMVVLALLASLSGQSIPLFIFVPFLVAVILSFGMSKLTALGSTVGAILVGMIGSTYGFNVVGYINNFLSLDVNNEIITKIILFIMLVFLLISFVNKKAKAELLESKNSSKKTTVKEAEKKEKKKETKTKKATKEENVIVVKEEKQLDIPFYEPENKNKKSAVPMIIIVVLAVIVSLVAMYNWYYGFEVTFFQDIHTSLMDIKIGSYPIVSNILGGISQFGYWGYYELSVVLILASLLLGWIYSIKFSDTLDSFMEGAKKMIGVAFYATICSLLFTVLLNGDTNTTIYNTITNFFLGLTKSFNVFTTSMIALIGGFFYNDFYYLLSGITGALGAKFDAATLPVVGLVFQTMYGFVMMLLPTSILLIAGLRYLEVSYKEWIKYIWKFLLSIFVIILIVLVIAMLFI